MLPLQNIHVKIKKTLRAKVQIDLFLWKIQIFNSGYVFTMTASDLLISVNLKYED